MNYTTILWILYFPDQQPGQSGGGGESPYVSCSHLKEIINRAQKMSCTEWCKYICSYVRLHVKWWVIARQSETGQRAALWHVPWAHTGGINNCLVPLYKSPDWCPWCCHMSEDEPTLSHWNRGKWRWCHSGPPFWLWCHQRNKSSHSCPQRCLLTSGKDGGGGERKGGREKCDTRKTWWLCSIWACMTQWAEHGGYMCQACLPIIQVTAKSMAVNYSWMLFWY